VFGLCSLIFEYVSQIHRKPLHFYIQDIEKVLLERGIIKRLQGIKRKDKHKELKEKTDEITDEKND
jgi:hypothetical protein